MAALTLRSGFLVADAQGLLEGFEFLEFSLGDDTVFPGGFVSMDEELFVRILVEKDVSNQTGVDTLIGVDHVEQCDRATHFFDGHVFESVARPHSTGSHDGGRKPAHDVRVDKFPGSTR